MWPVVLGGEFILLLFIGVMAAGCWSELRGGCFWEAYNVLVLLKSIGDIWFGCSREVGCFSEGLLDRFYCSAIGGLVEMLSGIYIGEWSYVCQLKSPSLCQLQFWSLKTKTKL